MTVVAAASNIVVEVGRGEHAQGDPNLGKAIAIGASDEAGSHPRAARTGARQTARRDTRAALTPALSRKREREPESPLVRPHVRALSGAAPFATLTGGVPLHLVTTSGSPFPPEVGGKGAGGSGGRAILPAVRVETDIESAKIEVLEAKDPRRIRLAVPPDGEHPRFRQWFCFGLRGVRGARCEVSIENAGACTWAKAFAGYDVCGSYDGNAWFRVPTRLGADGALRFSFDSKRDGVRFAYFAPWTNDRLAAQVLRARRSRRGEVGILGATPLGAPFPMLRFGRLDDAGPSVFVIAQQHPGEPMAGWFVEGLVDRLLRTDRVARAVMGAATISLVPRMNPDGVALGNHRTNAAGLDLNRQWLEPDPRAPEVAMVREAMRRRRVDLFLDVHGDEMIPHVFLQGASGIPSRTARHAALEASFFQAMLGATRDFQTTHGYGADAPGKANMGIAANWVAETFDCLSLTLEMPFKDHLENPDPKRGWSPERSKALGGAFVEALATQLETLR